MDAPITRELNPEITYIERLSGAAILRINLDGEPYTGTLGKVRV